MEPNNDPREPQRPYTSMVPMGQEIARRMGRRAFVVGFTCYEGEAGIGARGDPQGFHSTIRTNQDASIELEELLNAARFDYALVDLRDRSREAEWLKTPIVSRPLANKGMRAVWPEVLDAMFYIRVMAPNEVTRPR